MGHAPTACALPGRHRATGVASGPCAHTSPRHHPVSGAAALTGAHTRTGQPRAAPALFGARRGTSATTGTRTMAAPQAGAEVAPRADGCAIAGCRPAAPFPFGTGGDMGGAGWERGVTPGRRAPLIAGSLAPIDVPLAPHAPGGQE
ncbi:hypothetical protein GCM10023259_048890 [Thermocatellispora tengchongensis]